MKVFLDDVRDPSICASYMHRRIGARNPVYLEEGWTVVRNAKQFKEVILRDHYRITLVSFDHDLADAHYNPDTWTQGFKYQEETGYDLAKWMIGIFDYYKQSLPEILVHSMNPVGAERIEQLFNDLLHK